LSLDFRSVVPVSTRESNKRNHMRQVDWLVCHLLVGACASISAVGCGSGVEMGTVSGKVTYNSEPVRDGDLTFAPVASGAKSAGPARRPGMATIENGAFVVSTERTGDGLGVGTYTVSFNAHNPPWEAPEYDGNGPPPQAPVSEYAGLVPKETQVEVKEGANELNIELVKPAQ
jgi:hypothetical protein